jgi:hypothetical protein
MATTDGLAVIRNAVAATCQGGCNGTPVVDGFTGVAHVGVTSDGINKLYMSVNGTRSVALHYLDRRDAADLHWRD